MARSAQTRKGDSLSTVTYSTCDHYRLTPNRNQSNGKHERCKHEMLCAEPPRTPARPPGRPAYPSVHCTPTPLDRWTGAVLSGRGAAWLGEWLGFVIDGRNIAVERYSFALLCVWAQILYIRRQAWTGAWRGFPLQCKVKTARIACTAHKHGRRSVTSGASFCLFNKRGFKKRVLHFASHWSCDQ